MPVCSKELNHSLLSLCLCDSKIWFERPALPFPGLFVGTRPRSGLVLRLGAFARINFFRSAHSGACPVTGDQFTSLHEEKRRTVAQEPKLLRSCDSKEVNGKA